MRIDCCQECGTNPHLSDVRCRTCGTLVPRGAAAYRPDSDPAPSEILDAPPPKGERVVYFPVPFNIHVRSKRKFLIKEVVGRMRNLFQDLDPDELETKGVTIINDKRVRLFWDGWYCDIATVHERRDVEWEKTRALRTEMNKSKREEIPVAEFFVELVGKEDPDGEFVELYNELLNPLGEVLYPYVLSDSPSTRGDSGE